VRSLLVAICHAGLERTLDTKEHQLKGSKDFILTFCLPWDFSKALRHPPHAWTSVPFAAEKASASSPHHHLAEVFKHNSTLQGTDTHHFYYTTPVIIKVLMRRQTNNIGFCSFTNWSLLCLL
jgi:hypothetical protein